MTKSPKILGFENAPAVLEPLRAAGKRIVQCHGTWDLVHPGHVCHLEEARTLGDVLVVTVTADKYVNKGPGRPYFNETLRARTLAAIECVDYVVVVPHAGAVEAIECVRPQLYCKGKDYEQADKERRGRLREDLEAVARTGGQVRYIGSVVFSSTRLLNQHFDPLTQPVREFCERLAQDFGATQVRDAVESFRELKVLVIGDTIFDRYSYVKVQGLTSKNRIISGRFLNEDTQCGGAFAVVRHVQQFSDNVRFISLVGAEPWVEPILRQHLRAGEDAVVRDAAFTTIIKQRFVEPYSEGKELSKLFSVNFIDAEPPGAAVRDKLLKSIEQEIRKADVVLLLDFGHGMLQAEIRQFIQEKAPLLVLNCQTNSNNHGFNIISRQYQRADAFALDQQELMLAVGHRHIDFQAELEALRAKLNARYAWLTRGPVQTIGLHTGQDACLCPPLEYEIVDSIGAGDAFFSVAALATAKELPAPLATFLGQLAGAQAVRIIGNTRPISKDALVKSGMAMLSF
ncbi:MAG: adenylyltransferase/cytidyltransferase family protein [Verrucomicrobiota bacterium]